MEKQTSGGTVEALKKLIYRLNFQSETDRPVQLFAPAGRRIGAVTVKAMEMLTGRKLNEPTPQDHYTFDQFMDKHSRPEVQPQASRYKDLKAWMAENLTSRQVFRMAGTPGVFNTTYYVVGNDRASNLLGVLIEATET